MHRSSIRPYLAQRGVSMMELIAALTLAGVTTATVAPSLTKLETAAHTAKVEGAIGAVHSAAAMAHAAWLIDRARHRGGQRYEETSRFVRLEDTQIAMKGAWPAESHIALAAGIDCRSYGCYSQSDGMAFTATSSPEQGEACFVYAHRSNGRARA